MILNLGPYNKTIRLSILYFHYQIFAARKCFSHIWVDISILKNHLYSLFFWLKSTKHSFLIDLCENRRVIFVGTLKLNDAIQSSPRIQMLAKWRHKLMEGRKINHENTLKEQKVAVRKYCRNYFSREKFSDFYDFFPVGTCFMTYRDIQFTRLLAFKKVDFSLFISQNILVSG